MSQIHNWTGERLETFIYNNNTIEHLHRYALTLDLIKDKIVLDIASGEGYGSNLLTNTALQVYGVDIDETSIKNATTKYKAKNLEFLVGRADLIPIADKSIDVVVSFETLEHHDKHNEMFAEIKRVLKANGILIMSTPDKKYYTDLSGNKNAFHIKELYFDEFQKLVQTYFPYSSFYYQNIFSGSLIIPQDHKKGFNIFNGDFDVVKKHQAFIPMYTIVIAGNNELPQISLSAFSGSLIDKKQQEIINTEIRTNAMEFVKRSWNYKIGNFLLAPIRLFTRKK